jgi:subtilase family serine protease
MNRSTLAACFAAALLAVAAPARSSAVGPPAHPHVPVCPGAVVSAARCHSHVVTNNAGIPLTSSSPLPGSYGPAQFHIGYNLPCRVGGTSVQWNCSPFTSFAGVTQTIGIVDAYNDPTIQSDLNTYDRYYGLPACTTSNGCLKIVNQNGGSHLPRTDPGWAFEIALDVETAHAICQTCRILLVEAASNSYLNLGTAVNEAAQLGATVISNSYGGSEFAGETSFDGYYNHPGIAVTASSGDGGYGVAYPAASPYVVAVGGTTLNLNNPINNTYAYSGESAWGGAGSGCSAYETANSWQMAVATWGGTGCGMKRGVADVAADADPNTGAAVYDSTPYVGQSGWFQVGGTSLSSPLIASVFALAGGVNAVSSISDTSASTNAQWIPYALFTSGNSHDVTTGSNGSCSTIMCNATLTTGYDGPTGLGTPNRTAGF